MLCVSLEEHKVFLSKKNRVLLTAIWDGFKTAVHLLSSLEFLRVVVKFVIDNL